MRSADAFTVRRCQILLASARGRRAPAIARNLACALDTAHNALRAFGREGLGCLQERSSRPHSAHACLDERFTDAHFVIGLWRLSEGDRAGARDQLQRCVATRIFASWHWPWARAFLARMEKDPAWPPWIEPKK